MGKKKVAKNQPPPAPYSSPSPSPAKEDEPVTYPEEEQESPDQGEEDEELEVEEEEEESQSDSETRTVSPTASDFKIQAVARSPPKKPSSTKRPMQESERNANAAESSRKVKKAKRVAVEEAAEKNKTSSVRPGNRLWSEGDEVVVLQGLMDFESSDMAAFYEFMKKSLSVNVSKNQFLDKISKLRRKYFKNVGKGEKADLSRPHERTCFELSRKIWGENKNGGGGNGSDDAVAFAGEQTGKVEVSLGEGSNGRERKDLKDDEVGHFWAMHPCLKQSLSDLSMKESLKSFMMENMTRIGSGQAKALEKKWKDLLVDESVLYLKRVQLIREQTRLVLDAMKASKDQVRAASL